MKLSEFIEQKRRTCNKKMRNYLKEGVLSQESYNRLHLFNNNLARELQSAVSIGEDLLKDHIIESINDLLGLVRVWSPTEIRREMFKLIGGSLGRHNTIIRETAATLCRAILVSEAPRLSCEVVETHYELQGESLDELTEDQRLKMQICSEIAESIYQYMCYRMDYISERSEYLQPPLYTLKVVKGGDCDDLAMLLCSLWESIGYETTLHFLPSHCFPGVKLAVPVEREGRVKIYNVRADPTIKRINMFKLSYDLCMGKIDFNDLPEGFRGLYKVKSFTVPPVQYTEYCEVREAG